MSEVTEKIASVREVCTSTPAAVFGYLMGSVQKRAAFWLKHMADVNNISEDEAKVIATNFNTALGSNCSPQTCADAIGVLGLHEYLASEFDLGIVMEFEKAYNLNPAGQTMQFNIFKASVRKRCAIDVVHEYMHKAVDEFKPDGTPNPKDDKIAALEAFGIPYNEAKNYQWSGSTITDPYVNFYELAELTTEYPDLA